MAAISLKKCVSQRIKRLKGLLAEKELDAMIVTGVTDIRYLTGFSGDDSVLVVLPTRPVLVTDTRFTEQIKEECPGLSMLLRKKGMIETVCELLAKKSPNPKKPLRVGIDLSNVSVSLHKGYKKFLKANLKDAAGLIGKLRILKDEFEVKQIQKAAKIAADAFQTALTRLKPGMTEVELTAELEYEIMKAGGGPVAFQSIVAFGGHAAHPHAVPGKRKLKKNEPFLIDWGATVNGYRSDLTRCGVAGTIPAVFADAYQCVLASQLAAIEAIKPGVTLAEIDDICRKTMKQEIRCVKRAFPVYGHGTGHGVGLDIHEAPSISHLGKETMEEGMVVTIEPGIYVPGRFGIRIEDDVLVTAKGHKVLSRLAKDLESVALRK